MNLILKEILIQMDRDLQVHTNIEMGIISMDFSIKTLKAVIKKEKRSEEMTQ